VNAALGRGAVMLGFLAAVFGVGVVATGLARRREVLLRSGQRYVWLLLAGSVVAVVAMERALLSDDFSLEFVAENSARATPLVYKVATMWSALEGSILLWGFVLAGYLAVMARRFRDRATDPLVGWATLTGFAVAAFFFGLMVGPADPFREVAGAVPADGPGPNPLLQNHPLMAFHPPML
jgi:cytochrome c-type biogenesis protein CcmF